MTNYWGKGERRTENGERRKGERGKLQSRSDDTLLTVCFSLRRTAAE
ncbi:MAG: hypothetical protein LBF39_05600 [Prevotellaceae bacterium]|nr:hypothetical protein [Prevotellaceae bacterium]